MNRLSDNPELQRLQLLFQQEPVHKDGKVLFETSCIKCGSIRLKTKQDILRESGLCKRCSLNSRKAGLQKNKNFGIRINNND